MIRSARVLLLAGLSLVLVFLAPLSGCTLPDALTGYFSADENSSIYGNWASTSGLVEEQMILQGGASSGSSLGSGAGAGSGAAQGAASSGATRNRVFRNTDAGEPAVIHEFINRVLVDDEFCKISIHSKTADAFGDVGFILEVVNRYKPLTNTGFSNYCYITPVMGTWSVNGVPMDPLSDDRVYPGQPATIYLYFDAIYSIEELVNVKGEFELYRISDWWNPVNTYSFSQP